MFSTSAVGATNNELENDDAESIQSEDEEAAPPANCYQVVGTLSDKSKQKPNWVKEVYEVNTFEKMMLSL